MFLHEYIRTYVQLSIANLAKLVRNLNALGKILHLSIVCLKPNTLPNVRLAVIARLQHKDVEQVGYDLYSDIWREWPGVEAVVARV